MGRPLRRRRGHMPHLLFDIQTGVAGDMILGALFDLGLDFGAWKAPHGTALACPAWSCPWKRSTSTASWPPVSTCRFPMTRPIAASPEIRALSRAADLPARVKDARPGGLRAPGGGRGRHPRRAGGAGAFPRGGRPRRRRGHHRSLPGLRDAGRGRLPTPRPSPSATARCAPPMACSACRCRPPWP